MDDHFAWKLQREWNAGLERDAPKMRKALLEAREAGKIDGQFITIALFDVSRAGYWVLNGNHVEYCDRGERIEQA